MDVLSPEPDAPIPEEVVQHKVIEARVSRGRQIGTGVALVLIGLITVLVLGRSAHSATSIFDFNASGGGSVPKLHLPAQTACLVLGLLIVLAGIYQLIRGFSPRAMKWIGSVAALFFVLSFLAWAGSGGSTVQVGSLLYQSLFLATPLILGAMSGLLCERSGVINVAIEGEMLAAAFAGAFVGTIAGNLWIGVLGAIIVGGLMGAMLAVFSIKFLVNQVVLGVVLNVFALGLTGFLFDGLMANNQNTMNDPGFFGPISIPVLSDIPVIGGLLFNQNIIVYAMYLIVIVIDVALVRTRWGLRTRAVGEHPKAADTVGINVLRLRYHNVIMGGCVAGLAGAFVTIGSVGSFTKNITSGNGFIALAALIFGRWTPRGAVGAALLFGFATALQTVLSLLQTPVPINSNLLGTLPYLATIFAVAGLVGRVRAPAADGEPYVKG
ncbi:ABC transporter permease [Leekyejoonella antrihumi]|uniref:ABC transporter permease n=2 Tax=Leekyejoonella antrihumi TaxID=1660198 RepID=A0A563DT62_9MICO|nr:ABC transporter permease [Leekyejoonella antrihumi]